MDCFAVLAMTVQVGVIARNKVTWQSVIELYAPNSSAV